MSETKETTGKKVCGCVLLIAHLACVSCLWFWLLYRILVHVQATDIEWYVFWTYVPFSVIISALRTAAEQLLD